MKVEERLFSMIKDTDKRGGEKDKEGRQGLCPLCNIHLHKNALSTVQQKKTHSIQIAVAPISLSTMKPICASRVRQRILLPQGLQLSSISIPDMAN